MKRIKTVLIVIACLSILLSAQSCIVVQKKDNGKHKGWYKNTKNPHHQNSDKHDRKKHK